MFENTMRRALMRGSALALAAGCFAISGQAFAQGSSYAFDMPSEPLAKALHDYSAVSGQQIIFSDADVAGKTAPALKGSYSSNQALNILLAETDLVADQSSSGGIMVRSKNARAALDDGAAESVTVTGSRVTRPGFDSPAPITVVTASDLAISGNTNLADTLNELPSMSGGLNPSAAPAGGNYAGQNYLSLRGLGAARTLLLVDGEVFTPSTIFGSVSLNVVPQALVKQVEVVTGGASAQWGSDAIAGVVNLILDHDIEGVRGNFQGGTTDHGDYQNYLISMAAGHTFAHGKAHLEIAGEVSDNSGVPALSRDWLKAGWNTITNPNANGTPGQPKNLIVPNVTTTNASFGGVITSGPLKGIQFGPGGVPTTFNYGTDISTSTMVGGDGVLRDTMMSAAAPISRQVGYGRVSYDFTPDLEGYLEASYGHSLTKAPLTLPGSAPDTAITIKRDNAFLPASIAAAMDTNKITSFTMGRWSSDYAMNVIHLDVETLRIAGGLKGGFGDGWTWNAYYAYGGTNSPIKTLNNRNTANYNLAIDAVINPKTGAAVCRSSLVNPANGCVPLDLFGAGSPSAAAQNYVMGTSLKSFDSRRANGAATLNGEPFSTWAGPVSFATGVEYRHDGVNVTADPIAVAGGWGVSSQVPFAGGVTVWEGFGEFVVPLAKNESWAREINLDIAGRETGYSTSGNITTWKVGLSYAVNDSIRLRADRSRDLRAPALTDLYQGGSSANTTVIDRFTSQSDFIYNPKIGNVALRPETADTTTLGVVLTPSFLPNFQASIDYYDIQAKGLITSESAQNTIDNCYNYNIDCGLITRVNGVITQVPSTSTNLQSARTNGVDIEAEYKVPDGEWGWNEGLGNLTLHYVGTYLGLASYSQPGAPATQLANQLAYTTITTGLSGGPRWRFNLRGTWDQGPYSVSVTGRYAGGARIVSPIYTTSDYNILKTSSRFYNDVNFQYRLDESSLGSPVFFATVQNLFDLDPPIAPGSGLGNVPTAPGAYDVIGRQYTAGIRFSY